MIIQKLIKYLGVDEYYFVVSKNNEYNTTGKIELYALNSREPIAVGYIECLKELKSFTCF